MKRSGFLSDLLKYMFQDRITFYIQLLIFQIIVYSVVIHYFIPHLEGCEISWLNSLLFVLQTMTTVGYDLETFFPADNPLTLILIIAIMITGVFTFLLLIPAVLTPHIQDIFRPSPPKSLHRNISGHVIVAGFSEISASLIKSILLSDLMIVILEENEKTGLLAMEQFKKFKKRVRVISGSYDDDETWQSVNVSSARGVIVCEPDKNDNDKRSASIILGIRKMTDAKITAVIDDIKHKKYFSYAGADNIISPKSIAGMTISRHLLSEPEADIIFDASKNLRNQNYRKINNFVSKTDFKTPDSNSSDSKNLDNNSYSKNLESEHSDFSKKDPLKFIHMMFPEGCPAIGKTLNELELFERYNIEPVFMIDRGVFFTFEEGKDRKIRPSSIVFLIGKKSDITLFQNNVFACVEKRRSLAVMAGYDELGEVIASEFKAAGVKLNIISETENSGSESQFFIKGGFNDESVIRQAGIENAGIFIAGADDDDANIFTTLITRSLNPHIYIISRAEKPGSVEKMYRAGADYVELIPAISGHILAGFILEGIVSVLLDLPSDKKAVKIKNSAKSVMKIRRLESMTGAVIIAFGNDYDSKIRLNSEETIKEGDYIIAFGKLLPLQKLIKTLSGDEKLI